MIPAKEAKDMLYRMLSENLVALQVRVEGMEANGAPRWPHAGAGYCWLHHHHNTWFFTTTTTIHGSSLPRPQYMVLLHDNTCSLQCSHWVVMDTAPWSPSPFSW